MPRLLAASFALVFAAACGNQNASSTDYQNNSGAVALSRDDSLVYVADSDNGTLSVVNADAREKIADIKVGRNPEHVVVGPDDTIYVSNRGSRSVSVIRRDQWDAPVATVDVGVEPYAMAFADEGKTLLVVNSTSIDSTETGTLMGIDTRSLQPTFEIPVGDEPRGVAVVNGKALVSLHRKGEVISVDLSTKQIETQRLGANLKAAANRDVNNMNQMPFDSKSAGTFDPRSMVEVAATPDGTRAFTTVVWSSNAVLDSPESSSSSLSGGGAAYGGGPCGTGGVATAGAVTFDTRSLEPSVDPLSSCDFSNPADFPAPIMKDTVGGHMQGPTAIVVDPTGQWLFVANKESNNVAVMPTYSRPARFGSTVTMPVPVPTAPVGIAISRDSKRAWVYSLFAHQLVSIEATNSETSGAPVLRASTPIQIAQDTLEPEQVKGRELFFTAVDERMNSIGISCATCHVDVREDGHVWNFKNGPRQTPSLAGRQLGKTAPYHWNGEFPDFNAFVSHTVTSRMGGFGVTPSMEEQLVAFIDTVSPPDNPFKFATPTEAQVRGAQVFQKAQCNSCHMGETLTDNRNVDVGTLVSDPAVGDVEPLNTPSLLAVARTSPFLHDGSAPTLKDRINNGKLNDKHGLTSTLTEAEVEDLVAYLKSL